MVDLLHSTCGNYPNTVTEEFLDVLQASGIRRQLPSKAKMNHKSAALRCLPISGFWWHQENIFIGEP